VDWFKVTTTAASSSIVVNVSQLPKNYNLELYVGGAFVAGSYAAGTTSETITRTNQPAGTYYYRVYAATTTDYSSTGDYRILATVTPEAESHPTTNIADKEEILISFVTYPNPASDVLFIKPTEDIFMTGGRLKIVNVSGSVVYEKNMIDVSHDKPIEISLESFANGIYQFLLEDESNKLVATQRFIIQK
jgi:hypothetical protein